MQEIITYSEAKELGMTKYFTGKPCKNGHLSERYISGRRCVICASENSHLWLTRHPEKTKEYSARHYEKHRERRVEQTRQYHIAHRNEDIERARKYRRENPEKSRNSVAKWRNNNPEKIKIWKENNPESLKKSKKKWNNNNKHRICLYSHKRRVHQRLFEDNYTAQDVLNLYDAQKGRCAYCKKNLKGRYHVDHIIALSKGGGNSKYNIQICCPTCNSKKHNKDPIDFAQELGLLI